MKDYNMLTWIFFASKGITDHTDLMRVQMLCIQLCELCENKDTVTVEEVKDTSGYRSCIYDIPDYLISDKAIQEMIDFEI